MRFKTLNEYIVYLRNWIYKEAKNAYKSGVIIGISGGIDSACCLALCSQIKNIKIKNYYIDIDSNKKNKRFLLELEKKFKVKINSINATNIYKNLIKLLKIREKKSLINIKPRLRMLILYAIAQQNNLLVIGTLNADEIYTGYFTKYGDNLSDLSPLANLTKNEIYKISKLLNVPISIIKRKPSADLYPRQNDESELKVSYSEIDLFLKNIPIKKNSKKRLLNLNKANKHKITGSKKPLPYRKIKSNNYL